MPIQTIDAKTVKSWLDKGEAVLVDVREPAEYKAQNIVGSVLLPKASVCKQALPDWQGKKLVVHCQKGARGSSACEILLAEDPTLEIYNLEGGINAWTDAGFPITSSGGFFLPLDRQVQMTIGIGVLLGVILGFLLAPAFFLLAGFFGLGLTIAGLTGFCGLARLMAKMPWNR